MTTEAASYKGCTFYRTSTTTEVVREAYGRPYLAVAYLWAVKGRVKKSPGMRPLLTSARACREHIRDADAANAGQP